MKKKIFIVLALIVIPFLLVGGMVYYENYVRYHDVCVMTDKYIEKLYTTYDSYGLTCTNDKVEDTCHMRYIVSGVGRMVIVKIDNENASKKDYLCLKNILKHRYENSNYVNRVFINSGGTISIDCRR